MKILFVNTLYTPHSVGGAERFVQSLAEGLIKVGHDAVVASTAPQKGTRIDRINGVKVYYIGLKNLYWPFGDKKNPSVLKPLAHALGTYNPWMAREVEQIIDAEQPDLVHTNNLGGFSVLAWQRIKQRHLPLVHTLHDHYLLCPRGTMFRSGRNCRTRCAECRLYALPRKRPSNQVDTVVGVSRFVLERHLRFGYFADTSNKSVIPNAYRVESAELRSGTRSRPPIRFGYLGSLHPNKGLEVLLEAATQLPEGTWSLDVAGRGFTAYERYLHATYKRMPAIKFLGYVSPEVFFRELDVLVVPSLLTETFGRVVIEAYAHGVPVIGSSRGGIPELIENEDTGYLIDPGHPRDLTMRMQQLINNPAIIENMRPNCLNRAKHFLPENVRERYLEIYCEAVDGVALVP